MGIMNRKKDVASIVSTFTKMKADLEKLITTRRLENDKLNAEVVAKLDAVNANRLEVQKAEDVIKALDAFTV